MIVADLRSLATSIDVLHEDPKNARLHPDRNLVAITASLAKFGQRKPVVALRDGKVIAGNGTLRAARSLGWKELAVVRVDDDDPTAVAYAIADNRTAELAEWDEDQLAESLRWLDTETEIDVGEIGFTADEIDLLDGGTGGAGDDYTKKILSPIYEPKGENPPVDSLVDRTKTLDLVAQIMSRGDGLPDEVRGFLLAAAARHTVFHYERIAEFYAHAPKETQALMEASALVIIDFGKAIENGFVVLSDALAEAYADDA